MELAIGIAWCFAGLLLALRGATAKKEQKGARWVFWTLAIIALLLGLYFITGLVAFAFVAAVTAAGQAVGGWIRATMNK